MPPIKYDWRSGQLDVSGPALGLLHLGPRIARFCLQPVPSLWARWIFLRVLALCFCVGFTGFCFEGPRLLALDGFLPFRLTSVSALHTVGPAAFLALPSLLWLSDSSLAITTLAWLGLLCSLLLLLNLRPRATLFLCWIFFLSLVCSLDPLPDDTLLLEAAFLGLLVAPPGWRPGLAARYAPARMGVFLLQLLSARLLWGALYNKFGDSDAGTWLNLEGIGPYFEKVPFPTWLDFQAFYAPPFVRHAMTALVLATEALVPLFILFVRSRRVRVAAFAFWVLYNLFGLFIDNAGWFHLLELGLSLFLLDDAALSSVFRLPLPKRTGAALETFPGAPSKTTALVMAGLGLLVTPLPFLSQGGLTDPRRLVARWGFGALYTSFEVADIYRHTVLIEGSKDGGKSWSPYSLRGAGARLALSPFILPYLPRLTTILRRAVDRRETGPYSMLGASLLKGQLPVLSYFHRDPLAGAKLTDVRFLIERTRFNTPEVASRTGEYWHYTSLGPFTAPLHHDPGSEHIIPMPTYQDKDQVLDE